MRIDGGLAAVLAATACLAGTASAHGVVGARFFPATIATDDPFAADELALPTLSTFRSLDDGVPTTETAAEFEWSKTIVKGFAVSFEGGYVNSDPLGGKAVSGFDNLEITPALELTRDDEHEFIATAAFSWEVGGSGSKDIGDPQSRFTPALLFGKGLGDLPDSMALLRPLAVTGRVGYGIPGSSGDPHTIEWGFAVEYSLRYLSDNVRDLGLGPFWRHVTPVVEFALESPLDRDGGGTTGTVNPGLLWSGQTMQVGVEAILPVNEHTGSNVGVTVQLHFYIDDMFPHSLGTPLIGGAH
jgi:hypothetical protein